MGYFNRQQKAGCARQHISYFNNLRIGYRLRTTSFLCTVDIHSTLQRFWEIEDSQITTHHDPENVKVEEHFQTTHSRDSKERYTSELPFKDADPQFTDTLQGATQRFASVERRLHRDTNLHSRYVQYMQEYISLGHMRQLNPDD